MNVNPPNYTEEQLENFFQSWEEDPKSIEENPTQIDLNIPPLINAQDSPNMNQNPITELQPNNQLSFALPPLNPNLIATQASNNQSNPISGVPVESQRLAISPINPSPSNDESSPPKESLLFSFKLKCARTFCDAVEALADTNLNPEKLAMIEVDDSGFKIIVYNDSTRVMGIIHLKTELLDEFECAKNFKKLSYEIIDMFYKTFNRTQYGNELTIYYTEGSERLFFKLDNPRPGNFSFAVVEEEESEAFRLLSCRPGNDSAVEYVVHISTDELRKIIRFLVQKKTVTMDLTHMNLRISINEEYSVKIPTDESTGVPKGQKIHSEFKFPHGDSLRKACDLSQMFTVRFQHSPDRVLLEFEIEDLGTLIYLKPCVNLLMGRKSTQSSNSRLVIH